MLAGLITAALLLIFLMGCIWLWMPKHKPELDAAARIPLDEDREEQS